EAAQNSGAGAARVGGGGLSAAGRPAARCDGVGAQAPVRVLLVDDQALVRRGFRLILEAAPDIVVVGEAADGRAALEEVGRLDPDVVLMDIRMPNLDGLAATRRLAGHGRSRPRVLILTTYDLDEYVYEALRAGASG